MGVALPADLDQAAQDVAEARITRRFEDVDTADANPRMTSHFVAALHSVEIGEVLEEADSFGDEQGPLLKTFFVEQYGPILSAESPHANPQTLSQVQDYLSFLKQKVPASLKAAVEQVGFRSKGARVISFFLNLLDSMLDEINEEDDEEPDNMEEDEEFD